MEDPRRNHHPASEEQAVRARVRPAFVVGIGASAGGLASIEQFFHEVPRESRVAFVLVQHLSPDHRSLMGEILSKHTKLQVLQAAEGAILEPDKVYLIPPGKVIRVVDGRLNLDEREPSQLHFPIDVFFQSLAEDFGARALAVVLSGTGSDGTQGIRAIKQNGGLVLVQDDTAQFDGMPRSAISTGLADFILPPDQIATKIIELTRNAVVLVPMGSEIPSEVLDRILGQVREKSGVDFRQYREKTLRRRIEKRMWLRREPDVHSYAQLLLADTEEVDALARELMIGVTSLFRDPEAFQSLRKQVLPELFREGGSVRCWVVGCSTGEEAYSLAILFDDYLREHRIKATFRIFATDIDDRAIAQAGRGVFTEQIRHQIEPDLLQRSFTRDGDNYRVVNRIRERIVFAKHDVIKDPPFTKVDLVSCRNLLIHQQPDLQERTLGMLQFAVREGSFLWLGPTEVLGRRESAFRTLNSRWRIFRRSSQVTTESQATNNDLAMSTTRRSILERQVHRQEATLLSHLCSAVVRRQDQAAIVVSGNETVLYLFGNAAPYFTIPEGRPSQALSRGLAPALANLVSGMLRRLQREEAEELTGRATIPATQQQEQMVVELAVRRVESGRDLEPVFLVVLSQRRSVPAPKVSADDLDVSVGERISELESALVEAKSHLQMTIEELESSNEELQSANEELIASNEELQSTNEELHSVNEELHTVNAEYQRKLAEQHVLTADMEHLLQTTDMGTIFLDAQFRVRRYTPAVTSVIPLLPPDHGRPIGHIKHLLLDVDLEDVAKQVHHGSGRVELQVHTTDSRTFVLRAVPYHDYGDHVDGVVVTFFDITALDAARRELVEKERRFRQVAENIDDVIWVRDSASGQFLYLSPVAETLWGRSADDMVRDPDLWLHGVHQDDRARVESAYARGLRKGAFQVEYRIVAPDGRARWVLDRGFPVMDDASQAVHVAGVTTDVTASKQTEDELRSAAQAMSRLALNDALTGLHNRRGFEQRLAEEVTRAQRNGESLAAVLVDCDDFKHINDEHGHNVGDDVLREIARRINSSLRPTDVLARIGGDEFLALLPSTRNAEALRVAERMRTAVSSNRVATGSQELAATVSIGVCTADPATLTMSQLLSDLHQGLAMSKRRGKNRVADARGDGVQVTDGQAFGNLLRSDRAFRVVAQTIRDLTDNSIVGYELLSRGPSGSLETPDAFFRAASSFDMLGLTDMHCLRKCLQSAAQLGANRPNLRLHVNAYPSTLLEMSDRDRAELFGELPQQNAWCIEISEQQVIGEPTYLRNAIESLRDEGVRIAMDDVGFGRSSLESLIVLEPDVIKIDRSFVRDIAEEPLRRGYLNRLTTIADSLGSEIVAEGVETAADSRVLQDLGVRLAQGWLWDRPTAIESLN